MLVVTKYLETLRSDQGNTDDLLGLTLTTSDNTY